MACSSVPDHEYKAILVKNETRNATVFLDLFRRYDPLCWLPFTTKSIEPGNQYFFRDKDGFKYQLRMENKGAKKEKRKTLFPVEMWMSDKLLIVQDGPDNSGSVDDKDLLDYPVERQICIRRKNMEDETSCKCERYLYGILKLDMKVVQGKTLHKQDEMIKNAYRRQMLLFHPDHNPDFADSHICQEINKAYKILRDREKRALYHDLTDYRGGWLSKSRWNAIFKPEAHGKNEKWRRFGLLAFSGVCFVGGVVLTVVIFVTGGVLLPVELVAGALIGGSINGASRIVSQDSIEKGITFKKYAQSFAIGAFFGALTAGVSTALDFAIPVIGITAEATAGPILARSVTKGATKSTLKSMEDFVEREVVEQSR